MDRHGSLGVVTCHPTNPGNHAAPRTDRCCRCSLFAQVLLVSAAHARLSRLVRENRASQLDMRHFKQIVYGMRGMDKEYSAQEVSYALPPTPAYQYMHASAACDVAMVLSHLLHHPLHANITAQPTTLACSQMNIPTSLNCSCSPRAWSWRRRATSSCWRRSCWATSPSTGATSSCKPRPVNCPRGYSRCVVGWRVVGVEHSRACGFLRTRLLSDSLSLQLHNFLALYEAGLRKDEAEMKAEAAKLAEQLSTVKTEAQATMGTSQILTEPLEAKVGVQGQKVAQSVSCLFGLPTQPTPAKPCMLSTPFSRQYR